MIPSHLPLYSIVGMMETLFFAIFFRHNSTSFYRTPLIQAQAQIRNRTVLHVILVRNGLNSLSMVYKVFPQRSEMGETYGKFTHHIQGQFLCDCVIELMTLKLICTL